MKKADLRKTQNIAFQFCWEYGEENYAEFVIDAIADEIFHPTNRTHEACYRVQLELFGPWKGKL
jgi:hypothetical protein